MFQFVGLEAYCQHHSGTACCGMPVWCLPGWGVMCEASSLPPTQSGMQAHPLGATSVYMTQADL